MISFRVPVAIAVVVGGLSLVPIDRPFLEGAASPAFSATGQEEFSLISKAIWEHDFPAFVSRIAEAKPERRQRALVVAAEARDPSMVRHLLSLGVNPDSRELPDGASDTALFTAARVGSAEAVKLLLDAGANPNAGCGPNRQFMPVHIAIRYGHVLVLEHLLKHGADPNARFPTALLTARTDALTRASGPTALMMAASQGEAEMVELLLRWGAHAHLKDYEGNTVSDHARRHKNPVDEILRLLQGAASGAGRSGSGSHGLRPPR